MRQILPHWACFRSIDNLDEWTVDISAAEFAADKAVKHDAEGRLLWEVDRYLSGLQVDIDDDHVQEELGLTCDYLASKLSVHYIGIDPEIKAAIDSAKTNDDCLEIIRRAKRKWRIPE